MAVTAALLLTALTARAAAVTYEPEPAFCKRQVVHNQVSTFAQMPRLHMPSSSGRIGFGPASLRLETTPPVRVGGGEVGFTLGLSQRKGLSLLWTATVTIVEVNGKGRPIGRPRRTIKEVGWLKPSYGDRFQFDVPGDRAFYRATILFTGASGKTLGKFSFYNQIMAADPRARLNLNASSYRPESSVFMRVENLGNLTAFYGVDYDVEKLEGSTWIKAPENPRGPIILIGINALPGTSGPCNSFWVPPTMAPGSYRIAKEVDFVLPFPGTRPPPEPVRRPEATLTAEFQVAS